MTVPADAGRAAIIPQVTKLSYVMMILKLASRLATGYMGEIIKHIKLSSLLPSDREAAPQSSVQGRQCQFRVSWQEYKTCVMWLVFMFLCYLLQ